MPTVALIEIPAIRLLLPVEGLVAPGWDGSAFQAAVDRGPALDPRSPLPGLGHIVIHGHRTSHGAPFLRLGELTSGDDIVLTTEGRSWHYRVSAKKVVHSPTNGLASRAVDLPLASENRVTLVACAGRSGEPEPPPARPELTGPYRIAVSALNAADFDRTQRLIDSLTNGYTAA